MNTEQAGDPLWRDAVLCAQLFAVAPHDAGGVRVRARPGPVRDAWTAVLRSLLPRGAPFRRAPVNVSPGRLLGGLDLAATLNAGHPVAEAGLLEECDLGVLLLAMAERVRPGTAAHIAQALDRGVAVAERDGMALTAPARFGAVLFDEGLDDETIQADEGPPTVLLDRLSYMIDLDAVGVSDVGEAPSAAAVERARTLYQRTRVGDEAAAALTKASIGLGVTSLRPLIFAARAARAHAALHGRTEVSEIDAVAAARLVLAPRATIPPPPGADEDPPPEETPDPDDPPLDDQDHDQDHDHDLDQTLADMVLAAAQAVIPPGLLARLEADKKKRRAGQAGRSANLQAAARRGRPAGLKRGRADRNSRLNVIETLRAASPWQALRKENRRPGKVQVRKQDFRFTRYKQRSATTTVFVVDASGSAALHRLAEVKGAVELMLAECYLRRDQIALIAFRGQGAELILPPTRSLTRAKRGLAGLPGGGGTPLAAGLDAAGRLAGGVRRKGQTPVIVVMTDGRANIARDGSRDRVAAAADAADAARRIRAAGVSAILVDASPRPQASAENLADEMDALYLALPHANAAAVAGAVAGAGGT